MNDPSYNTKIETPVKATPMEILFMILKFSVVLRLPINSISKLMVLLNAIFEKPVLPMESKYMIDKFFNHKDNLELYVTCTKCKRLVGKLRELSNDDECPNPKCKKKGNVCNPSCNNLIAIIDPSETIKNLLESHAGYYDKVVSKNYTEQISSIKDVYDGKMYREFVNSLPQEDRYNFVTLTINSDGAQPFEKAPRSLWPLYIMLNELPIVERLKAIIACALWFNRKKPNFQIFLDLFVDFIKKTHEHPIECNINGTLRSIKLYVLMCVADSVARAPMQGKIGNDYFF